MDETANRSEVVRWVSEKFGIGIEKVRLLLSDQLDRHYYWRDLRMLTIEEYALFGLMAPAAELRPKYGLRERYLVFRDTSGALDVADWDNQLKKATRRRGVPSQNSSRYLSEPLQLKTHLRNIAREWKIGQRQRVSWRRALPWKCPIEFSGRFFLQVANSGLCRHYGVISPAYLLTPANEGAAETVMLLVAKTIKIDVFGDPYVGFHLIVVSEEDLQK